MFHEFLGRAFMEEWRKALGVNEGDFGYTVKTVSQCDNTSIDVVTAKIADNSELIIYKGKSTNDNTEDMVTNLMSIREKDAPFKIFHDVKTRTKSYVVTRRGNVLQCFDECEDNYNIIASENRRNFLMYPENTNRELSILTDLILDTDDNQELHTVVIDPLDITLLDAFNDRLYEITNKVEYIRTIVDNINANGGKASFLTIDSVRKHLDSIENKPTPKDIRKVRALINFDVSKRMLQFNTDENVTITKSTEFPDVDNVVEFDLIRHALRCVSLLMDTNRMKYIVSNKETAMIVVYNLENKPEIINLNIQGINTSVFNISNCIMLMEQFMTLIEQYDLFENNIVITSNDIFYNEEDYYEDDEY